MNWKRWRYASGRPVSCQGFSDNTSDGQFNTMTDIREEDLPLVEAHKRDSLRQCPGEVLDKGIASMPFL